MVRPNIINMNPSELKYHPFLIILNNCNGCCDVWSPKICVPKETKDINVKAFNMIRNKDDAEATAKHISCDYKCNFSSTTCISNQTWNNIKLSMWM